MAQAKMGAPPSRGRAWAFPQQENCFFWGDPALAIEDDMGTIGQRQLLFRPSHALILVAFHACFALKPHMTHKVFKHHAGLSTKKLPFPICNSAALAAGGSQCGQLGKTGTVCYQLKPAAAMWACSCKPGYRCIKVRGPQAHRNPVSVSVHRSASIKS